jgi:predicted oxidoreductase (fatty acid repression mutant protein)
MHQLAIWTALDSAGLGVNLQHYNPLIDAKVAAEWSIPEDWVMSGQMVFGTPTGSPKEKSFKTVEERFRIFGA